MSFCKSAKMIHDYFRLSSMKETETKKKTRLFISKMLMHMKAISSPHV